MKSFKIKSTGMFMTKLLTQDCFDEYLLEGLSIKGGCSYSIDGHIHPDFYRQDESDDTLSKYKDFVPWKNVRAICHQIIKGKNTPLSISITLHAPESVKEEMAQSSELTISVSSIKGLVLSIRFDGSGIVIVSAVSLDIFTMDKSAEHLWDKKIPALLSELGIDFDEI